MTLFLEQKKSREKEVRVWWLEMGMDNVWGYIIDTQCKCMNEMYVEVRI